jgi:hypothetical protein
MGHPAEREAGTVNIIWCKIVSWHAVADGAMRTLCGRALDTEVEVSELPAGKSCESCLRIVARRADEGTTENA